MVSPISVPGNQTDPTNRRNSFTSASLFSPFSPPGGTAAALGSSPPTATNISSSTAPGFGTGFLGGPGLARSISHGKQIGQAPLMSPTSGGMAVVNDKGARAEGILRRLSLGSGARVRDFSRADLDAKHPLLLTRPSQTDITSTGEYFHTLPPPQNASASSSSGLAPTNASKPSTSPSFYANPFSGAVLHEAHDEHDHDLVSGMASFSIGKKGDGGDGFAQRRASSAITGIGSQGQLSRQEGIDGLPRSSQHPEGTPRPRKISFGWSGFMSGKKDVNPHQQPLPPAADRGNNTDARADVPPSILVRRESAPVSPPPPALRTTLDDQSRFKFGSIETGANKVEVSVIVHPVSPSSVPRAQELDSREIMVPTPSQPQLSPSRTTSSTASSGTPSSNTKTSTKAKASSSPSGLLGFGGTAGSGSRGRKGAEATGPGPGKKRSVSPMAEHLLRGGPGQF
ncbi:hypothetical protein QFC19_008484 [Naganishia cerealis]|uniref:Uncharacterized protein n=1 Tax=Naganishia cerealis TaxID=610337 RepID=A0ACC2V286_9TREE|nr:hypothetical protein QFC19_008484 [Naganishia cerealis]